MIVPELSNSTNATRRSLAAQPNTVSVHPMQYNGQTRWHWRRNRHAGHCGGWSQESFDTEFRAYVAAADIARCLGYPLVADDDMRIRLIDHWEARGRQLFGDNCSIKCCANQYERNGYREAAAEYAAIAEEADLKPELDYAPVSVQYAYTEVK